MTRASIARAWRRGQQGWPSRFVVFQFPNLPLLVALAGLAVARFTDGRASGYAEALGRVGLTIFAYLEVTAGVNWLRRLLGAVVLAHVVVTLGRVLN